MSAKRKTRSELQAELDAANKRCADLADALVKALMAQPIYYPVPYYTAPVPPIWYGGGSFQFTSQNVGVCAGAGNPLLVSGVVEMQS